MNPGHLKWSLDFAVGNTGLDDAHRELVDLYNRIAWACENDNGVENVRERIRAFLIYARWHFDEEETFMRRLHYPGYMDHKADHQRLLQDAADFVENFGNALRLEDSPAITSYFKYWLTRHMADKDCNLRNFLNTKESASESVSPT